MIDVVHLSQQPWDMLCFSLFGQCDVGLCLGLFLKIHVAMQILEIIKVFFFRSKGTIKVQPARFSCVSYLWSDEPLSKNNFDCRIDGLFILTSLNMPS